jgi:hypothetical protein
MWNVITLLCLAAGIYAFLPKRHKAYPSRITSRPLRAIPTTTRPPALPLLCALIGRSIASGRMHIKEGWKAFIDAYDGVRVKQLNAMSTPATMPLLVDTAVFPVPALGTGAEPEPEPIKEDRPLVLSEKRKAAIREALLLQLPAGKIATIMGGRRSEALALIREIALADSEEGDNGEGNE